MSPTRKSLYEVHDYIDIYGVPTRSWTFNNNYHRIGGPAIEYGDGSRMWYLEGVYYDESDYWHVLWSSVYVTDANAWLCSYVYWGDYVRYYSRALQGL